MALTILNPTLAEITFKYFDPRFLRSAEDGRLPPQSKIVLEAGGQRVIQGLSKREEDNLIHQLESIGAVSQVLKFLTPASENLTFLRHGNIIGDTLMTDSIADTREKEEIHGRKKVEDMVQAMGDTMSSKLQTRRAKEIDIEISLEEGNVSLDALRSPKQSQSARQKITKSKRK